MKLLILVPLFLQLFCSCRDEKDIVDPPPVVTGPKFSEISISGDNVLVDVVFSEGVYKGGLLNMPLNNADLLLTLTGGTALLDSFRVSHTAGDDKAGIRLFLKGIADGNENLTIKPSGPLSIVNQKAVPMKETEQLSISLSDIGIIGNWVSTGEDLSQVFQQFGFDSVFMQFRADGSYMFESFTHGGIHNILSGTYQQSKSNIEGIQIIVLNQQSPVVSTISGIFRLFNETTVRMIYETVQTEPAVAGLTPPTPELGFGSTGLLGSDNTQKFVRTRND